MRIDRELEYFLSDLRFVLQSIRFVLQSIQIGTEQFDERQVLDFQFL